MNKDNIDILIAVGTVIASAIGIYVGLRLKALKSEIKETHVLKTDYKNDIESSEESQKDIDTRLRATENKINIVDDRVKAIFIQMDKQSEQMVDRFDKIEVMIRNSFKDNKEDSEKRDREVRDMIKELYQTKKDKD